MKFKIGTLLTVSKHVLVSEDGLEGLYKILDFLTGDVLFTHQIPRVLNECSPYIDEKFPWMKDIEMPRFGDEKNEAKKNIDVFLEKIYALHGKSLDVEPMPAGRHAFKNPIVEASEMMKEKRKG